MQVLYVVVICNQLLVEGHQKGKNDQGTNGCKFEALRFRFKNDRSGCKDIQVKMFNCGYSSYSIIAWQKC